MDGSAERWMVAYTLEGAMCRIVHGTLDDVADFLAREDQTAIPADEWRTWFASDEHWIEDENWERFRFETAIGEGAFIEVTRVTLEDVLRARQPESGNG